MSTQMQTDPHENLHTIEDRCFDKGVPHTYLKGNFLGKGGFARCYELYKSDGTGQIDAVKIVQKSSLIKQRSKQKLMSEIKIHRNLQHKNIVQFKHHFEDHLNVYIVMELCKNKTLNDMLKRKRQLCQNQIKYYLMQVLQGLQYLHINRIIHRDLKLGNLFINENLQIKIGDFGLATKVDFVGEKKKTICGTPNYIAPEILQHKGHSYEVDIWSFGVIMYTLLFGRPPFESKDVKQTYKKIKMGYFGFPQSVPCSSSLKNLLVAILKKDPHKRPTLKQLRNFDFFTETTLTRQPSFSFKAQSSISITKDERQLSDNGKLYTNNDLGLSKDTTRQKSQEKFVATERTNSLNKHIQSKPVQNCQQQYIKRTKSQKVLKDITSNHDTSIAPQKSPQLKNSYSFQYISVKKWIDYSSKYGIGYVLNNGSFGVYFNDSTKILSFGEELFYYIEKIDREDVYHKYSFAYQPSELKKKVSLYNHFKGYLQSERQNKLSNTPPTDQKKLIYVRRWFRSKHAVIFRLSNKSVQVIFIDQSQLLISSIKKQVIYINKYKDISQYSLANIMQSENRQLIKRFQYTKDVLNEMASNNHEHYKKQTINKYNPPLQQM